MDPQQERRILEETVTPLTPHSSCGGTEAPPTSTTPQETIVLSLADWERKQDMLEKEAKMNQRNGLEHGWESEHWQSRQLKK